MSQHQSSESLIWGLFNDPARILSTFRKMLSSIVTHRVCPEAIAAPRANPDSRPAKSIIQSLTVLTELNYPPAALFVPPSRPGSKLVRLRQVNSLRLSIRHERHHLSLFSLAKCCESFCLLRGILKRSSFVWLKIQPWVAEMWVSVLSVFTSSAEFWKYLIIKNLVIVMNFFKLYEESVHTETGW